MSFLEVKYNIAHQKLNQILLCRYKIKCNIVQLIDELQQGRVPIDQPQTGRLEYYQGKYHSTKKILFTKVSAEQKAMQKIMSSMREQGMQIPEMLLKVGVRILRV